MDKIKKELEITHPSFEYIREHFKKNKPNLDYFNVTSNEFIYHNFDYPRGQNYLIKIDDSKIKYFGDKLLVQKLKECIEHLNTIFQLKFVWLMVYPPKSFLNFHRDYGKNRHVVSFCENDRFFNYETSDNKFLENNREKELNDKFRESIDNIDDFNEYYKNLHESCFITTLESNCIYTFGNTLHTFFNGSDTVRVNLVFEIVE